MRRYDRIFLNLANIHDNLDTSEPYNATNKFKEILAGSKDTKLDSYIPDTPEQNTTVVPGVIPNPQRPESAPESANLMAQAKQLDKALEEAKGKPESERESAIKTATENIKKLILKVKALIL